MKATVWRDGPPPSIGWWPASRFRLGNSLRWWDGKQWSNPAGIDCTRADAAQYAKRKDFHQYEIEWTDRPASWPERSRT